MSKENQIISNEVSLGEKLKIARTKKGISINELAEAIDITAPYLVRIENNVLTNPGIITFIRVCNALDLSDTEILKILKSLDT